ncbi:MAG: dimethyl sulfoxide reductase anchor subunit [Robiginitomaculum sp.]|nr:dimethyl sulfoxide reductase anchor subunit [Robiginitomaculum sp.]
MHPAKSVIYFTTATGAGYGLFIWLALLSFHGLLPADKMFGFIALAISFGLVVTGLLSSTMHLGHPERAWRALSQWRSSWLSREGVMAVLTFIPMSIFAIAWVFMGNNTGGVALIGLLGAIMALITVYTTSMIYASIKAIPAWYNVSTKLGYLILCLMSGAVLAMVITFIAGYRDTSFYMFFPVNILLLLGLMAKVLYWRHIHSNKAVSTAESATGLGRFGKVSLAESPHSSDNYLLKEMGFKIARKHASKLRVITVFMGFLIPFALIGIAMHYLGGNMKAFALLVAAFSCILGLVFERWLFFAEAKHAVTLFYGESKI